MMPVQSLRVLFLSQEPPFDPDQLATGNALRAHQFRTGLEQAGHHVEQRWLDRDSGAGTFRSADELLGLIQHIAPDVILVSYWELLELLPFEPPVPVVLDFLAPRPLEVLFETPERVGGMLRRLRIALARCDLMLVGNAEQEKLLAYWLLEAGFDLRTGSPVRIVGLAGAPVERQPRDSSSKLQLVAGGVRWPWRDDAVWADSLERLVHETDPGHTHFQQVRFGGSYRWDERPETSATSDSNQRKLTTYAEWSAFLCQAHIGLELGNDHIERRFSQSFRSLDFLRHGMPVLCTAGQPLAQDIEAFGAGWVVRQPDDIRQVLLDLKDKPATWQNASNAALALLSQRFDPAQNLAPLLEWLKKPQRAARLEGFGLPDPAPPVLGVPPLGTRLKRRYRLARRVVLARLFTKNRVAKDRSAIVMVTREDLFPTDHGAAVKIVETARGLSRNGREVLLVTQSRKYFWRFSDGDVEQCRLPRWLSLLGRPQPLVKLDHYTRDIPESNAFLYLPLSDGSFFWRALWVAARHKAAVLQAEFPAYALPCLRVGEVLDIPVVMVEHNVEYDRLRAQIPELSAQQYETFRAIEIDLCNRCDAVICVSDNDRQKLAADGVHPGRLHTIPHGINLSSFDESEPAPARERFDIPANAPLLVYHGTFAYPPNRDALMMLASEILPRLERAGFDAHVLAIGHQPPEGLHPKIHCTGSVEQVAPWIRAADIAVVPLREGGGTRMKIIDDFAAGLPVVSTAKGIEGIPVTDGRDALIRNDWDAFSEAVGTLIGDAAQRESIAAAGRAIADQLDWHSIGARYLKLMDSLSR